MLVISLSKNQVENNTLSNKFRLWSFKNSLNPIILGDKNFAIRLQSFFATSPLLVHFDHNAMFDDYSEKNLLILVGPLGEVQKTKVKSIINKMNHAYKVIYLEMTFEEITSKEDYILKLDKELGEIGLKDFIIEDFISLDHVAQLLREIA